MPAICPECGTVHPQETSGTPGLACPRCGRTLLVEPSRPSETYAALNPLAAAAASPFLAGAYPEHPQTSAPRWTGAYPMHPQGAGAYPMHPKAPSVLARKFTSPEYLAQQYGGTIVLQRWLAGIIDYLVLGIGVALLGAVLNAFLGSGLRGLSGVIGLVAILAYFPVLEGLCGTTAGKHLIGLQVVDRDGNLPGLLRSSVRALLRLVELNPLFFPGGLIAGITALVTPGHQRLGDLAAGTYVLTDEDAAMMRGARQGSGGWSWNSSLRRRGGSRNINPRP
jgi:uncharacterized RDD family membrane protein YckC